MYRYVPKMNICSTKTGFSAVNLAAVAHVRSHTNKRTTGADVSIKLAEGESILEFAFRD